MNPEVAVVRTTACPTAVVRAETTWREVPARWGPMLDQVWAFLGTRPGLRTDGHNVMLYRTGVPGVEVVLEVGVQVTGDFEAAGAVVPSLLPATETATAVHRGPVAELGQAHAAVWA
jgi:hypothetical protein